MKRTKNWRFCGIRRRAAISPGLLPDRHTCLRFSASCAAVTFSERSRLLDSGPLSEHEFGAWSRRRPGGSAPVPSDRGDSRGSDAGPLAGRGAAVGAGAVIPRSAGWFFRCCASLPFAGVGVLVAARKPRNPIGWIMLMLALAWRSARTPAPIRLRPTTSGITGCRCARLAVVFGRAGSGCSCCCRCRSCFSRTATCLRRAGAGRCALYLVCATVGRRRLGIGERALRSRTGGSRLTPSGALATTGSNSSAAAAVAASCFSPTSCSALLGGRAGRSPIVARPESAASN